MCCQATPDAQGHARTHAVPYVVRTVLHCTKMRRDRGRECHLTSVSSSMQFYGMSSQAARQVAIWLDKRFSSKLALLQLPLYLLTSLYLGTHTHTHTHTKSLTRTYRYLFVIISLLTIITYHTYIY